MKRLSEETTAGMDEDAKTVYMDKPVEVTDSSFAQFIRKHPLVVVDCWAAWCGPCRMLAPIIDELAREYSGKILFGKLNVDEKLIRSFLDKKNVFAVVGASRNPEKYGHRVYRDLKEAGYTVYPVNPNADEVLGDKCYPKLESLPVGCLRRLCNG